MIFLELHKPDDNKIKVNLNHVFFFEDNLILTDEKTKKPMKGKYARLVSNTGASVFVKEDGKKIEAMITSLVMQANMQQQSNLIIPKR